MKNKKVNAAKSAAGKIGAKVRNASLTPEKRSALARHAANTRWAAYYQARAE